MFKKWFILPILQLILHIVPWLPCTYRSLCVASYSLCHKHLVLFHHSPSSPLMSTHNSVSHLKTYRKNYITLVTNNKRNNEFWKHWGTSQEEIRNTGNVAFPLPCCFTLPSCQTLMSLCDITSTNNPFIKWIFLVDFSNISSIFLTHLIRSEGKFPDSFVGFHAFPRISIDCVTRNNFH